MIFVLVDLIPDCLLWLFYSWLEVSGPQSKWIATWGIRLYSRDSCVHMVIWLCVW